METKKTKESFKTKCGLAVQDSPHTLEGGSKMRKVLVLLVAVGLLIGLSACGATVQQSVKAETPTGGGGAVQSYSGEGGGYHACQDDGWIEDTPFGY